MEHKALLMAGLLTNGDIQPIIQNITGEELGIETITEIISKKVKSFVNIDTNMAGKPKFCEFDLKYASILDSSALKIRESKFFGDFEWNFKNVEIGPLISSALFLDKVKIESFFNIFSKSNYSEILNYCLEPMPSKIRIQADGNSIHYQSENNDILGFKLEVNNTNLSLNVVPVLNNSPVKVIRVLDKYRLIDEHCRAIALKMAGCDFIPAIVLNDNPGFRYTGSFCFLEHMLIRENPPVMEYFLNENCTAELPLSIKNLKVHKVQVDTISVSV